jgi:hypothetical protein
VESNQSINMKSTILVSLVFFGLAMTVHGFPGTRDTAMGQADLNNIRIKRSGKIFDQIKAIKAALIGEALELKKKGLAFLEDVVNHFKEKVQMGQSFVGGTNSSTNRRIKRSAKLYGQIKAIKAAFIGEALELKKKGLAFLEDVVNHFKSKVQMGQSFVGTAGGTNSSTKQRPL